MKTAPFIVTIIFVAIVSGIGGWELKPCIESSVAREDTTAVRTVSIPSDRDMARELIRYDITESGRYAGLSLRQQEEYLVYLEDAADRYDLPMIIIHTVAYVESGYNPMARHPQITVKGKRTRALGLMGVVWEYNSKMLMRDSIATTRLELAEPRINLLAGAAIIHYDIERILAKNPNISEDKFFDELIRKYYGAYDETYKSRMLTKMKDIASKQWIRRTVKNILTSRIVETELPSSEALAKN